MSMLFSREKEAEAEAPSVATSGIPLAAGTPVASESDVIEALRTVYDPEIPVNIYDLGLIYQLRLDDIGSVSIEMTLTAPNCPVAGALPKQVADTVSSVPGVGEVQVALVWDPPWTMERLTTDARFALNLF